MEGCIDMANSKLIIRLWNVYHGIGKSKIRKDGFMQAVVVMLDHELQCADRREKNNVVNYITGNDPLFLNMYRDEA
jgi:hypothetical protein